MRCILRAAPHTSNWLCGRRLTADVSILDDKQTQGLRFQVSFRTPYLRQPIAVERDQIGTLRTDGGFEPGAFRLFDWHSWDHIDGHVEWLGTLQKEIDGEVRTFVTGFRYRSVALPAHTENLGLRLAEGIEGTARVLLGNVVERLGFEPSYWMLEREAKGYRMVAIVKPELMVAVVSLADLGSSNAATRAEALDRLEGWVNHTFGGMRPERRLVQLLQCVRDWGALGQPRLFSGLRQLLERLGLAGHEQALFEFFADHWGVRDNWHGRLVVIRLLEAQGTEGARLVMSTIHDYVQNREIPAHEMALIRSVLHGLEHDGMRVAPLSDNSGQRLKQDPALTG